ncbi:MAG: GNAT family N-acetyltransferase [Pseudomonadota bacterium]
MDCRFQPVTHQDLQLLRAWMETPHWQEWWGEVDTEIGYIKDMIEGRDSTRPFVFVIDDVPTGYIQYWFLRDAKQPPWSSQSPWVLDFDDETIGVDLGIGEAAHLSIGIGSRVLRAFVAQRVKEGFTKIIIDPDIENKRAIHAYEKAGFVRIREADEQDGSVLLMQWKGNPTS